MSPDQYQQAYLDHQLTPHSLTRLVANSGSGKTTTIASKISKILSAGEDSKSVIAITFTNKAAWELRSKVKRASGQQIPYCSTFHGLSILLLKESGVNPIIMNEWQSILLIRKIMESNNLSTGNKKQDTTLARDFMNKFNYMRVITYDLDPLSFPLLDHFQDITINLRQFIDIYMEYDRHKKDKNLWDFQDLISPRSEKLITIKPDAKYIWIDEAQDNDYSQYIWILNLFQDQAYTLVGDTKQKLYSFRWAFSDPMDKNYFWEDRGFTNIKDFPLVNNYRSTANIVKLFNATARKYDHLPSVPYHPEVAGSVKLVKFEENTQEGHYIAKRIRELMSQGVNPKDITILARRSSYLKQIIEPSLVEQQIPYILSTPLYKVKFFEIPLNQLYFALLSYVISDDLTKLAQASLHLRGIGKTNNERITNEVLETGSSTNHIFNTHLRVIDEQREHFVGLTESSQLALRIIPLIAKEDIWTEIKLQSIHKTFVSFIKHIEYEEVPFEDADSAIQMVLDSIYDYHTSTSDAVTLTTVHSYKGLENKFVFVGDLTYTGGFEIDDSTYPTVYVALSRAQDHLTVVYSEKVVDRNFGKIKAKLHPAFNFTLNQLQQGK